MSEKTSAKGNKPNSGSGPQKMSVAQQAREMLESFAIAFILMLMMRNCLGENYQIPTGSMAPTLQGRHMDVLCAQCGFQYRTGASVENEEQGVRQGEITGTRCPICRFPMALDKQTNLNHRSFAGDRIIVSKLAYWFAEPERWDVIVFKCPADAKINYIKRLIGLPGETLLIRHGDIFVRDPATAQLPQNQQRFRIARKPPDKVKGMLQLVDDTRYIGPELKRIEWPSRWIESGNQQLWRYNPEQAEFEVQAGEQDSWLRYRHIVPDQEDWQRIIEGGRPDLEGYEGMLITDYYTYNDAYPYVDARSTEATNWVGDLAIEGEVIVNSDQGELLLDLVEGGTHFTCRIDIASGSAKLEINGGPQTFRDEQGNAVASPTASTPLKGSGTYDVRFANVDDQLFLWINDKVVEFNGATTFESPVDITPKWSPEDAGDFMPLGIGARNASVHVSRLRVLRDVYYLAVSADVDYRLSDFYADYQGDRSRDEILDILSSPQSWSQTDLFRSRRQVTFSISDTQFFPLGDNSPQSKDARLWSYIVDGEFVPPPAVERELMIGKAVAIYWPHAWYLPFLRVKNIVPNFQRIGFIH